MNYSEGQHTGMPCHPSAFPQHVLAEATAIAPGRNKLSDGICGDPAHAQRVSDHNPDPRGVPHAIDITQDVLRFDAHRYGLVLAQAFIDGHGDQRIKYLVSNYGHGDVIFDPAVSLSWRSNPTGNEHVSHLHVSFHYTPAVEQSTAPFFHPEDDMPLNAADMALINAALKDIGDRIVASIAADINGAVDRIAALEKTIAATAK